MERPVTRTLLATFIEYAAVGKVTPIEWHRLSITPILRWKLLDGHVPASSVLVGGTA
jgi:hypothetical protein